MALPDPQLKDRPGINPVPPSQTEARSEIRPGTRPEESGARLSAQLTLALRIAQRNRLRALRAERLARLRPAEGETVPPVAASQAAIVTEKETRPWDPVDGEEPDAALENFLRNLTIPQEPGDARSVYEPVLTVVPAVDPVVAPVASAAPAAPTVPVAPAGTSGSVIDLVGVAPVEDVPAEVVALHRPESAEVEVEERALDLSTDLERLAGTGPGLIWALRRAGLHCLDDVADISPEDLVERLGPIGRLVPARSWIATARALRVGWQLSDPADTERS